MAKIEVSEATYETIEALAREKGLTPSEWVVAQIPASHGLVDAEGGNSSHKEQTLADTLQGYIGVIDSSKEQYPNAERTPLGDMVAEKLAEQGIKAPWQR